MITAREYIEVDNSAVLREIAERKRGRTEEKDKADADWEESRKRARESHFEVIRVEPASSSTTRGSDLRNNFCLGKNSQEKVSILISGSNSSNNRDNASFGRNNSNPDDDSTALNIPIPHHLLANDEEFEKQVAGERDTIKEEAEDDKDQEQTNKIMHQQSWEEGLARGDEGDVFGFGFGMDDE